MIILLYNKFLRIYILVEAESELEKRKSERVKNGKCGKKEIGAFLLAKKSFLPFEC